jgi:hypothetical protein
MNDGGSASAPAPSQRRLAWDGASALRGLVYAIPAAVLLPIDQRLGLAVAVGVLPAAIAPLAPRRCGRVVLVVLGALIGLALLLGSVMAALSPWVAVLGLFVLCVATAALVARRPRLRVLLVLGLPLVAVGFSYPGLPRSWPLAVLLVTGAVYAWLVSLPWPERAGREGATPEAAEPEPVSIGWGVRLGLAGGVCAAVGFALDFDHVGWAAMAAMIVMRPTATVLRMRAVGRALSVVAGALAAVLVVTVDLPRGVLATVTALVVVTATATARSRWYVTPAFTTFLVLMLLVGGDVAQAVDRLGERVGETALGVAVALVCGLALRTPGQRAPDSCTTKMSDREE